MCWPVSVHKALSTVYRTSPTTPHPTMQPNPHQTRTKNKKHVDCKRDVSSSDDKKNKFPTLTSPQTAINRPKHSSSSRETMVSFYSLLLYATWMKFNHPTNPPTTASPLAGQERHLFVRLKTIGTHDTQQTTSGKPCKSSYTPSYWLVVFDSL